MGARKSDFCVSVGKANFTDHDTPDTMNGSRDSALACQIQAFPSSGKRLQWLDYMNTNHYKMYLNIFSTTYTY